MAMIDYGAIAFKNGKCIQTGMFTPMIDMVGWEDTNGDNTRHWNRGIENWEKLNLTGNYFSYIGDEYLTVVFYKELIRIVTKCDDDNPHMCDVRSEWFGLEKFKHWTKWADWGFANNRQRYDIKVTKRNGYYVCKMKYNGDKYKVYFGYGVDYSYYKDWHMVNYYRNPSFLWYKFRCWCRDKIEDYKYYHS